MQWNERKQHKGLTYNWCGEATGGKSERWVVHDPKKCQGKAYKGRRQGKRSKPGEEPTPPADKAANPDNSDKNKRKKTEFAKALSAEIINGL